MTIMKKAITRTGTYSLLAILLVLAFSTCKKDAATASGTIIGKWANTYSQQITQYEFKSDSTFEMDVFAKDSVTKNITGYRYKSTGKYTLKNSVLTLYDVSNFSNPNSTFGPITALAPITGAQTSTYTIKIDVQKNQLLFYFICPPNANCIASPIIYYRE
jgi:hypothetical protein